VIAYTKLKILLEKYGLWGTAAFWPHRYERKTPDPEVGGVGFGNFAVDFLAFTRLVTTTGRRTANWFGNCYARPVHCFRPCLSIAKRINKYLTGPKTPRYAGFFGSHCPNFTPILSFSQKKPTNKEIILTIKTAKASRKRTFLAIFKKRFAQDLHN
jgi:hypothetical protein